MVVFIDNNSYCTLEENNNGVLVNVFYGDELIATRRCSDKENAKRYANQIVFEVENE